MLLKLTEVDPQHCFRIDGNLFCNWTHRNTKNGPMAMLRNDGGFLKFPAKVNWKKRRRKHKKEPPDLEALGKLVKLIHQKEKTPQPTKQ